ncbi:hypothetical protein SETIT_3G373400v2 [Setaria italica]|uniref:Uncharacterized protein n=1 Tax=Setaria italica TaxID=4555 RepID=A0A368QNI0_SETIT|nr:hypothetical protein SETIT_3G373400v2 [Setaria italica]
MLPPPRSPVFLAPFNTPVGRSAGSSAIFAGLSWVRVDFLWARYVLSTLKGELTYIASLIIQETIDRDAAR